MDDKERPRYWICEEVNEVIDLATQLGVFAPEDHPENMQAAVMLLLVKELKALRHYLEGRDGTE